MENENMFNPHKTEKDSENTPSDFDETKKAIGGEIYISKKEIEEAKNQGNKNIVEGSNDGGRIITDHIDKMISNFKQEEESEKMVSPKMKKLSDSMPMIDGGIIIEEIMTKSPDKKGRTNNKVSKVE